MYTTTGLGRVETEGVPPGKLQLKVVAFADEVLLNCTVSGAQPLVIAAEKPAAGGVMMVIVCVDVLKPQGLAAVRVTVYVPSLAYVCPGLVAVLVLPSPKFQLYDAAFDEVLVKVAVAPFTLLVKPAPGKPFTVIYDDWVVVFVPAALLTVRVTPYVPGVLYTTVGF